VSGDPDIFGGLFVVDRSVLLTAEPSDTAPRQFAGASAVSFIAIVPLLSARTVHGRDEGLAILEPHLPRLLADSDASLYSVPSAYRYTMDPGSPSPLIVSSWRDSSQLT